MGQTPSVIADLIDRFERNREAYKSPGYNETRLRVEFLDPFFKALGWDVHNELGHAEAYKDVIHEDAIRVGGVSKAPDYCFRIGGVRKFFLEAKNPSVNVKDDPHPAYQLRRYAWSAKLPLSILTDFEEFAVYDCRTRPSLSDKSTTGRVHYWTFKDYLAKWDDIAAIFSKDAILKGSFDKYAVSERRRGTATVDAEFLSEIEHWREALAKNLAVCNKKLAVHDLNFAVQRTIDRIIFLRICEDRSVEHYGQLQALLNGERTYARLRQLFTQADDRYNSGLFHFEAERDRAEAPDTITPSLKIDDKVLKDILKRLYYPDSPYEFSVFPLEILGQVYEQFLGKVIRLTAGHQAKVEEKPEVKKAGGVYYTPSYIVNYIVQQTVGVLCKDKTPKQIEKLRILDPACGSGSFLIGAYTWLLDYHRDWYIKDGPDKHKKELFQTAAAEYRLTTQEKKRILLNNIYGVDIDGQAVEVTKLSLLLKVLEGESDETLKRQLSFIKERALPDLGRNIKCGNSLIGPDYFTGQLLPDEGEMRRVNPFDWKSEFPEIMRANGFDVVIGNPPYGASFGAKEAEYFASTYEVFGGVKDVYTCFIERGFSNLNNGGMFSFIVPSAWLGGPEYKRLRQMFLLYEIERLVVLPFDVFSDAYIDTAIFVVTKRGIKSSHKVLTHVYAKRDRLSNIDLRENDYSTVNQDEWDSTDDKKFVLDPATVRLLEKIRKRTPLTFGNVIEMKRGVLFDKAMLTKKKTSANSHPYFEGDVYRYILILSLEHWVEFGDKMKECPKEFDWFDGPRILLRRLVNRRQRMMATLATKTFITNKNLYSVLAKDKSVQLPTILGILNSRLISYLYINQMTQATKDDFPQVTIKDVLALPFPAKSGSTKMNILVERMLDLNQRLTKAKSEADKTPLQRQVDATDQEIDRLVYDLYGLTEDEIKIVEAASVASSSKVEENNGHETGIETADGPRSGQCATATVAQPAQYAGEGGGSAPESPPGSGEPVHGIREPTGQYGPPQDPDGDAEGQGELGSTRYFETAEGRLSYQGLSERLAVPLVAIYDEILQNRPDQITITSEWLCIRHKRLAGHLFPDWAGRFRDVNVQVGSHTPPPFYEVPVHMRQFCDDLTERLRHDPGATVERAANFMAWADWRFQWIHPFRDFNGRIGRVLLAALLYKLGLPHVETAPLEPQSRREYLDALQLADQSDLSQLIQLWIRRIIDSM